MAWPRRACRSSTPSPAPGIPSAFSDYEAFVAAVEPLLRCGAIPELSYLWWDVRLQPRYGTLEVRVMDAQTTLERTATLVALVHALAAGADCEEDTPSPEVLEENRFRALRDGIDATFIDPETGELVPVAALLERCPPIDGAAALLEDPGPAHQRAAAHGDRGLISLVQDLVDRF